MSRYKYHLFRAGEALCVEADGFTETGAWMGFYLVEGTGQRTTFPPEWKRVLFRAKPRREPVEIKAHFHWVRHALIRRLVIIENAASAGEAGTAETTKIGSAEGEHATAKPGRPNSTTQPKEQDHG